MKNIKKNVEHQVSTAMIRYKALIDEGRLTVVGAVYDFVNALGKGHGRLVITNVNGVTGARKIKELPQLEGLDLNNCLKA